MTTLNLVFGSTIANVDSDSQGRFNLNEIFTVSNAADKKRPSQWKRNAGKALIREFESRMENPILTQNGGRAET